jgi:hypothetical protein
VSINESMSAPPPLADVDVETPSRRSVAHENSSARFPSVAAGASFARVDRPPPSRAAYIPRPSLAPSAYIATQLPARSGAFESSREASSSSAETTAAPTTSQKLRSAVVAPELNNPISFAATSRVVRATSLARDGM